jgi:hypothetical protein
MIFMVYRKTPNQARILDIISMTNRKAPNKSRNLHKI